MSRLSFTLAAVCAFGLSSATTSLADPATRAAPPAPSCDVSGISALPAPEVSVLPMAGNAVFSGCWTRFSSGTCRGVFSVDGGYKICGACGPGGTPPKYNGQCTAISSATLASGYWCS